MVLPITASGFGIGVAVFAVGMHLRRKMKQEKASKVGNIASNDPDLNLLDTTKMIIAGSVCAGAAFLTTTVFGKSVRFCLC
jgi:hypothetical protein